MVKLIFKCRKCGTEDDRNTNRLFYWSCPSVCRKCLIIDRGIYREKKKNEKNKNRRIKRKDGQR